MAKTLSKGFIIFSLFVFILVTFVTCNMYKERRESLQSKYEAVLGR